MMNLCFALYYNNKHQSRLIVMLLVLTLHTGNAMLCRRPLH